LYKAIVKNLSEIGVRATDIKIILVEVPAENGDCEAVCLPPKSTSASRWMSDELLLSTSATSQKALIPVMSAA
jgi:hypothetical protein